MLTYNQYYQYLDSLDRLHLTDHNGMAVFLEYRFMIERREALEIVDRWERSHETVLVDSSRSILCSDLDRVWDIHRRRNNNANLKTRG